MNALGSVEDVLAGMEITESHAFTDNDMECFAALANDHAGVHHDGEFARLMGYEEPIVFGFLVGARFSGMLGNRLPGPNTVLHSVSWQMVNPVYVGETITYKVAVSQVSRAVKTVVLKLSAEKPDGALALRGSAQCGFKR